MTRFFIGPMSLNIVDTIADFCIKRKTTMGLIPSRRQVDFHGGYVNNWNTNTFSKYVKNKNPSLILQRDHGGPAQGQQPDDGIDSFLVDSSCMDIIHLDPWRKHKDYEMGLSKTIEYMSLIYSSNKNVKFEIGTEEAIRRFEVDEFYRFLKDVKERTPSVIFKNIEYAVVQSGVGLDLGTMTNTGKFNSSRLNSMTSICKEFGVHSKEHNGDYLTAESISKRFNLGLSAINIAPEFGQIETLCYLETIKDNKILTELFEMCYLSGKWKKWVPEHFSPEENRKKLIKICCHYIFSTEDFKRIKPDIDNHIKKSITKRLEELYEI